MSNKLTFDDLKNYSNLFTEIVGHAISNIRDKTFTSFYFANDNDKMIRRPIIEKSMVDNEQASANPNAIYLTVENLSVINSKSHITISRDHWNKSLLVHATVYFTSFDNSQPIKNDGGCYYVVDLETLTLSSIPMVPEIKRSRGKNGNLSPENNVPSAKVRACIQANLDKNVYPQPTYVDLNKYYDKVAYNGHLSVKNTIGYLLDVCKIFISNAKKWKHDEVEKALLNKTVPSPPISIQVSPITKKYKLRSTPSNK